MDQNDKCINYIEFQVTDIARAKSFYGSAFGWTFTDYGPDYCEFNDGFIKGGFETSSDITLGGPLVVLYDGDLESIAAAIESAGGTICKPTFDFPGGRRFHFTDPEGYELAVWSES